ncbi:MAG TPA: hypothetical protein VIK27_08650, partial [Candidatus Aquilonibacter sp.]
MMLRRWETLTALAAVVVASVGALPIAGRVYFTAAGVMMIAIVGGSRVATRLAGGERHGPTDE